MWSLVNGSEISRRRRSVRLMSLLTDSTRMLIPSPVSSASPFSQRLWRLVWLPRAWWKALELRIAYPSHSSLVRLMELCSNTDCISVGALWNFRKETDLRLLHSCNQATVSRKMSLCRCSRSVPMFSASKRETRLVHPFSLEIAGIASIGMLLSLSSVRDSWCEFRAKKLSAPIAE